MHTRSYSLGAITTVSASCLLENRGAVVTRLHYTRDNLLLDWAVGYLYGRQGGTRRLRRGELMKLVERTISPAGDTCTASSEQKASTETHVRLITPSRSVYGRVVRRRTSELHLCSVRYRIRRTPYCTTLFCTYRSILQYRASAYVRTVRLW